MIKVYSTFTEDIICASNGEYITTKNGGPAFFIKKVLDEHRVKHQLFTGDKCKVRLTLKGDTQTGALKTVPKKQTVPKPKKGDVIIISTVNKEWLVDGAIINPKSMKIFIDVKGYTKGGANRSFFELPFWSLVFCIKGTEKEVYQLPEEITERQKNKCLVVTKGREGAVIYFKNKKYVFGCRTVKATDTIGAGDTFFAAFVLKFLSTQDIVESAKFATLEAEKMLLQKS